MESFLWRTVPFGSRSKEPLVWWNYRQEIDITTQRRWCWSSSASLRFNGCRSRCLISGLLPAAILPPRFSSSQSSWSTWEASTTASPTRLWGAEFRDPAAAEWWLLADRTPDKRSRHRPLSHCLPGTQRSLPLPTAATEILVTCPYRRPTSVPVRNTCPLKFTSRLPDVGSVVIVFT